MSPSVTRPPKPHSIRGVRHWWEGGAGGQGQRSAGLPTRAPHSRRGRLRNHRPLGLGSAAPGEVGAAAQRRATLSLQR